MLFNSLEFLIFLPLVFIGYWFVFKRRKIQNLFVFVVSYVFYGWWNWKFLFLIFLTTLSCYFAGLGIDSIKESDKRYRFKRRAICGFNIILNVTVLCFFKYFNFFVTNLKLIFDQLGYPLDWFTIDVLLPVGISFYTFQAISYPIDVYRKKINATHDFVAFGAFISFFPQLVAGPIERSTQLLPQFESTRNFDYAKAVEGMRQMLWGFFKKMVIADNCALLANQVWNNSANSSAQALWLGAFFFTFQIYGDFSGYSDIAIGVSKLFGINLTRNFHFPYFSRDIAEFWRRWHISLNTWFVDYIYIPLGGSRCSKPKVIRNTMIIFLISGLWHGADWTFVLWGVYHGLLFLPMIILGVNRKHMEFSKEDYFPKLITILQMCITFFLVMIGWVIFRSDNIVQAWTYLNRMFTAWSDGINPINGFKSCISYTFLFIFVLQILDWTQRHKSYGLQIVENWNTFSRRVAYLILAMVIMLFVGTEQVFIYFQF